MVEASPLLSSPRRLERHKRHRSYHLRDGTKVFSASTIAGVHKPLDPLLGWVAKLTREGKSWKDERDAAGDIGTIAHFMIECYLLKTEWDLSEFFKEEIARAYIAYQKFVDYWEQRDIKLQASEIPLVSEAYGYGGTLDLVGLDEAGLNLYDFKTSAKVYESHLIQAVGYAQLWNENNPDPIMRICILRIGKEKSKSLEAYWLPPDRYDLYWNAFLARLEVLKADRQL